MLKVMGPISRRSLKNHFLNVAEHFLDNEIDEDNPQVVIDALQRLATSLAKAGSRVSTMLDGLRNGDTLS